jgi:hypothetical protein
MWQLPDKDYPELFNWLTKNLGSYPRKVSLPTTPEDREELQAARILERLRGKAQSGRLSVELDNRITKVCYIAT